MMMRMQQVAKIAIIFFNPELGGRLRMFRRRLMFVCVRHEHFVPFSA